MIKLMQKRLAALRPLRFVVAICAAAFLLFSTALPAFAAKSSPSKGEETLLNIERKAQEKATKQPASRSETQAETKRGLNVVQGEANKEKMYNPEKSKKTGSVERNVQKSLEKATGKS